MKRFKATHLYFTCLLLLAALSGFASPTPAAGPPVMTAVARESNTTLRLYFNEVVTVAGTYNNEFTLTDCKGNSFAVSAIDDDVAGDTHILLTTADLSAAQGDLSLTFFNLNDPILDLDSTPLDTDGTGLTLFPSTSFEASQIVNASKSYLVAENTLSRSFALNNDGTKMFILGTTGDNTVYEYDLSTPFEIGTISYSSKSLNVEAQDSNPHHITFNPSGSIMYMVGLTTRRIYEYTLTTNFDIGTASLLSSHAIPSETLPTAMNFSGDGLKVYIMGALFDHIREYTLVTPYDLSGLSSASFTDFFDTNLNIAVSFTFNHDGTKLYTIDRNFREVNQYTLTKPYTLAGAVLDHSRHIGGVTGEVGTMVFSSTGDEFFAVGTASNTIHQLSVGDNDGPTLDQIQLRSLTEVDVLFNETVDAIGSNPSNFAVLKDGVALTVDQVSDPNPGDQSITLTLNASTTLAGVTTDVQVTYADPGNGEITDSGCNAAKDDATGIALPLDTQAPSLITATIQDGQTIVLAFDGNIQTTGNNASNFTITDCRGINYTAQAIKDETLGDQFLELLVDDLTYRSGDLSIDYTDPGNQAIFDGFLNPLANLTTSITSSISDFTLPTIAGFSKNSPTEVTITFSENVSVFEQFPASFTVSDGSNLYAPNAILDGTQGDNMIKLTFGSPIAASSELTVTYNNGSGNNEISDFSCNNLASDPTGITINIETVAPQVRFVQAESSTELSVYFDEPIQLGSGISGANFVLTDCDATTFNVTSVMDATLNDNVISLIVDDFADANGELNLQITTNNFEITDLSGNTIAGGSLNHLLNGEYNMADAVFLGASEQFNFQADSYPLGLAFNDTGLNMFMVGLDNKRIYRYQLSAPYDVSSAVLTADSLDVSGEYDTPLQIGFDPTGTKMHMVGVPPQGQLNYISQFSLSTAYDITTASFSGSYDSGTTDGEDIPTTMSFNADGSKMLLMGTRLDAILQYSLSTNYDISTATFLGNAQTLDVLTPSGGSATSFVFNDNGSFLYLMSNNLQTISEYYLSIPYDVTSAVLNASSQTFMVAEDNNPRTLLFNGDGSKAFISGEESSAVYEYQLVDQEDPMLVGATLINNTTIELTFTEPVKAAGSFPGDFSVVDLAGSGSSFAVTSIVDATPGDEVLTLTVNDLSSASGDIQVTYSDLNNEVVDLNCNDMTADPIGIAIDLDMTAPTMISAVVDNNTQVSVTFSELVQTNAGNPSDFVVTDGAGNTYNVTAQSDGVAQDAIIVLTTDDLSGALGDLSVTYTNNNQEISDFGNNELATDAQGVDIDLDQIAPTITSGSQQGSSGIALTFSEPVQVNGSTVTDFGAIDGAGNPVQLNSISDNNAFDTEVILSTSNFISAALGDVFISYTNNNSLINDFGGNTLQSTTNDVLVDLDQTAPTLVSVSKSSDTELVLTFSEPVQTSGSNANDFEVIDDLSTAISVSAIADGTAQDDKLVLTVSSLSVVNNDITVTFIGGNGVVSDFGGNDLATDNVGVTLDIVAPATPSITGISDDNGANASDGITNDNTLLINGSAEANSTVELFFFNGNTTNLTATADGGGSFVIDLTSTLADGSYPLSVRATDAAGNTSAESQGFTVTVDTNAPTVQSIVRNTTGKLAASVTAVDFAVSFSEPVSGIDAADFEVVLTGTTTGQVGTVTVVSVNEAIVEVTGISGEGTIGLNLKDDDSIEDTAGNFLGGSGTVNGDFTGEVYETKSSQTITFTDPTGTYGDVITLSATASSGLAVSYALVSGPATLSGDQLSITGVGAIEVEASQAGDADFNAASDVSKTFTPSKAALTVTADDQSITFGDALPSLTITYSGFIGSDAIADLDTPPTAATTATATSDAGTYPITASGGSDDNYSFSYTDGTLTINQASQTVTFDAITDIDLASTNTVSLVATASSGLAVDFTLTQGDGTISGSTLTANTTGIFTVEATQGGNTNYAAATAVTQTFNVNDSRKTDQTITFNALDDKVYGDAPFTLAATASSSLPVTFTVAGPVTLSGSDLTITGAGLVTVTASQAGDGTFNPAASVDQSFVVGTATLTVTPDDQQITFGDAIPTLTFTYDGFVGSDAISDLDSEPTLSTLASATSDVGTYDITASGGSDDNYTYTYQTGTLTIVKADQTITFDPISNVDLASVATVSLAATASSGLDVVYTLTSGDGAISGNVLTVNATGNFTVEATQVGDNNFNAATAVTQSFQVIDSRKMDQTITFAAIADQVYGDQLTLSASASSNLAVSYTLTAGAGTLTNGVLSIEDVGSYTITASQTGDTDFNPAVDVVQSFTVAKADLTVTADDQTIDEGSAIPTLTFGYAGFKLTDEVSDVDTQPTISTTATAQSAPGDYAITLAGGDDNHYTFTLVAGTLSIEEVLGVGDRALIQVYPNPAVDKIVVSGDQVASIQLIDLGGKTVRNTLQQQLDLSSLSAGTYVVVVKDKEGAVLAERRIIKE